MIATLADVRNQTQGAATVPAENLVYVAHELSASSCSFPDACPVSRSRSRIA